MGLPLVSCHCCFAACIPLGALGKGVGRIDDVAHERRRCPRGDQLILAACDGRRAVVLERSAGVAERVPYCSPECITPPGQPPILRECFRATALKSCCWNTVDEWK